MRSIKNESIGLVVTSPPYPMIGMWDEAFEAQALNTEIKKAFEEKNGNLAFELMHKILNRVWDEVYRVLIPGGLVCINIGDATRTVNNNFQLYQSHSKIIEYCRKKGLNALPSILWRKPTNSPTKFMGSGMLPPGAYVTLEHEYIIIFRKGNKREFNSASEKKLRRESAYFWEERNIWFSDIWNIKGVSQKLKAKQPRERSAAYPFELASRLINMFSIKFDTILDPFVGTGTTSLAAITSCRNSIGYEINEDFKEIIRQRINGAESFCNEYIDRRINSHNEFVKQSIKKNKVFKYNSLHYGFPVMTRQETQIKLNLIKKISKIADIKYEIEYIEDFVGNNEQI
jgi:DNA modification methylase